MMRLVVILLFSFSQINTQGSELPTGNNSTLVGKAENKKESTEESYFELSRYEMDKTEKETEAICRDLSAVDQLAGQAALERKIDKCLAILKVQLPAFRLAVSQTCNKWLESHKGKDEKNILRRWIKGLQNKYPEEIYPLFVETVEQIFEKQNVNAYANMDKIIIQSEQALMQPQKEETEELEKLKSVLLHIENGAIVCELASYAFSQGAETKAFTLITIFKEYLAKIKDQTFQKAMLPISKELDVTLCILTKQEEKLLEYLESEQTDINVFLHSADALLQLKTAKVLKELNKKRNTTALKAEEKVELAKLFWRCGDQDTYDDIIGPLLKASSQSAFEWHNKLQSLSKGVPADASISSLVRLEFPFGTGTGFFITKGGVIATAAHNFAVDKKNPFSVKIIDSKNTILTPSKIYIDPINDLALVLVKNEPESYFTIHEGEVKAGATLNTMGFPLSSTQCYFQTVQVVASLSSASNILLTGENLPGMSGGPVTVSNQVVGVNSSNLGPIKARLLNEGLKQLDKLRENETNAFASELNSNPYFNPELIFCARLQQKLTCSEEIIMPPVYETPRTFNEYCKKMVSELSGEILQKPNSTVYILETKAGDKGWNEAKNELVKKGDISRELIDYIDANQDKKTRTHKYEEILKYSPNFSPALKELIFYSFLRSIGKIEEYESLSESKQEGAYEVRFTKIQDTKAFKKTLELMKRYYDMNPSLRWEFLPRSDAFEEVLKLYSTLKKIGPLLIAQEDGPLSDERLKSFAKEGNTLAMASLAERLIGGQDAFNGYMFALQSAESGEPQGQSILAFYLLSGTSAAKNVKRGFDWALKSAEAGDPRGSTLAGICLIQGIGTVPDKAKGMELLQKGIKGGDPTALQIANNPGLENQIQFRPVAPTSNPQQNP